MAWFSSPCQPLYCRIRLSDRRTRRPPPLSTRSRRAAPGICHSRQLPTQRRRQSGPNGTSPTQSPQCGDASSLLSPGRFPDAPAAIRRSAPWQKSLITDAVRIGIEQPLLKVSNLRLERGQPFVNVEIDLIGKTARNTAFAEFALGVEAVIRVELVGIARKAGVVSDVLWLVLFAARSRARND